MENGEMEKMGIKKTENGELGKWEERRTVPHP